MASEYSIRWHEFSIAYIPTLIIWTFLFSFLSIPKYSQGNAILQSFFLLLWSYFGHIFAHKVSSEWPFNILNPHVYLHHNKAIQLPRWLELTIEAIVNFYGFFIIYIIQELCNIHIFSSSILLGSAFLYVTIHILDYSILGKDDHVLHHTRTYCNYDPEIFDTLFHTRCDPEKPYTNMMYEIPHAIFAFILAALVKYTWDLD